MLAQIMCTMEDMQRDIKELRADARANPRNAAAASVMPTVSDVQKRQFQMTARSLIVRGGALGGYHASHKTDSTGRWFATARPVLDLFRSLNPPLMGALLANQSSLGYAPLGAARDVI
jgi:hypothetical protein